MRCTSWATWSSMPPRTSWSTSQPTTAQLCPRTAMPASTTSPGGTWGCSTAWSITTSWTELSMSARPWESVMLYSVVNHYFVDGAVHVCQTMGVCDARKYTCDECVQGLEWVEGYLEDPIMTAEFVVYLQQNFCTNDMRHCHENV